MQSQIQLPFYSLFLKSPDRILKNSLGKNYEKTYLLGAFSQICPAPIVGGIKVFLPLHIKSLWQRNLRKDPPEGIHF